MRVQRFGTFVGGIDLPDEKAAPRDAAIEPSPRPQRLRVPLDPCGLGDAVAEAVVGQAVRAGERIGRAGGDLPVFAPLDGRVTALTPAALAGGRGTCRVCPGVEIEPTAEPQPWPEPAAMDELPGEPPESLLTRFAEGGLVTLSPRPAPLHRWCAADRAAGVDVLIVNALENQPWLSAGHRLLVERGSEVVAGMSILAAVLGVRHVMLAVDLRRTGEYRSIVRGRRPHPFHPVGIEPKYPAGADVILTKLLTRREVPPGGRPLDVGVATVTAATCVAVAQWILSGRPLTARVVTVAGHGVAEPGNLLVPLGAFADELLATRGAPAERVRRIHGGPMTGTSLGGGTVVGPATDALLTLPPPRDVEKTATTCIRCSWCTDHCPVRLNVAALNDFYELGRIDRAEQYSVSACIGCGVCTYVCPAKLPLTDRMTQLRCALRRRHGEDCSDDQCGRPECGLAGAMR